LSWWERYQKIFSSQWVNFFKRQSKEFFFLEQWQDMGKIWAGYGQMAMGKTGKNKSRQGGFGCG